MTQEIRDLIAEARKCAPGDDVTELAVIVHRLADALEAVTPVPVQGEPNDELIEYALDYIENGTMPPARREALRALASRAAVPDAATELVPTSLVEAVAAERDAAVAAIERVRAVHEKEPVNSNYGGTRNICLACEQSWPCLTIEALDGAPEPEWEYSVGFNDPECGWINDNADIHDNYEDARSDYSEPHWLVEDRVVRRRPAGPWLPVEGEGKP